MENDAASRRLEWLDGEALVFDSREQKLYRADAASAREFAGQGPFENPHHSALRPAFPAPGACFLIGEAICGVAFADESMAAAFRQVFGHLEVQSQSCDLLVEVALTAAGYEIRTSEKVEIVADAVAAAISLKADILDSWLSRNRDAMAFHAAALKCGPTATMLVGSSGQGKTTLAATMHARGCELIADDVALLTEGAQEIRGFASAFATKAASWPVLAPAFPELDAIPELKRPDGKIVRYLKPRSTATSAKLTRICFPKFKSGALFETRPMARSDALVQLLSEARNHLKRLSPSGFATLCEVVRSSEVLALQYGDAADAADRLMQTK